MNDLTLIELRDLYLLRCKIEGKSPHTLRDYGETVGRFIDALPAGVDSAGDVGPEHIYAYLGRYTEHSLETRHRYFREVRCFFRWLVEFDYLPDNPFRGMRNVRLPERIIQPLTKTDISRLLAACDDSPSGKRDRAIVLLLLDTGARCSEVVSLDLADLDLAAARLRVLHAKGNKQRVVPIAEHCSAAMNEYLSVRGDDAGPLFVSAAPSRALRVGVRLRPNGLKQLLRRLGRRAGVEKVHSHRFRHTFATWAIQHDARELDVQYLLGHATQDMVRRYSSTYRSEQAATRHGDFSPADQMLAG
jgi:integrase/recombinase XerD